MRISLAQFTATTDVSVNAQTICHYIERAAAENTQLIVFPEASMYPFDAGRLDTIAEPLDGPFLTQIRQCAEKNNIVAVIGMFAPADTKGEVNRIENVAAVVGRAGEAEAPQSVAYRKVHCYDAFGYKESDTVRPGSDYVTFQCGETTVGLAICFDIRFPQQFKELARRGADLIVVPTSWADGPGKRDQWRALSAARALDSTTFIAAACQARPTGAQASSTPSGPTGIGHSVIVGPDGVRRAELGYHPGLLTLDIDPGDVQHTRRAIPVLQQD